MPKLTDNEAYDLMHAALLKLGNDEAETLRATTALAAARMALHGLMFGLVAAMEVDSDDVPGVKSDPPD